MKKEIRISDDKTAATVTIELPYRDIKKITTVDTSNVIAMLEEMGYTVQDIVQFATVADSTKEKCKGTWVFLLVPPKKEEEKEETVYNILKMPKIVTKKNRGTID